ncbi:uncharacterized protein LOC120206159 [Hibiscus syriacus]|uniref:uncharacterized protein LOC120206159 n=1 Tax=Hibiscus syriacus TaxID=106335 RepID=UPI00192478C5|nr:uncharacterized protein LOC120206159 [Hibiscus syriacus]
MTEKRERESSGKVYLVKEVNDATIWFLIFRYKLPLDQAIMTKLGFNSEFVATIMRCVTSVIFTVNGSLTREFTLSRGLRQCDPLSPFLFLFVTQGLSVLFHKAQREGTIKGIRACRGGPPVSHLLFADDSLCSCRILYQMRHIKEILQVYAESSGQNVNSDKSIIYFSPKTIDDHRRQLTNILGIQSVASLGLYLGLPLYIGKNKIDAFGYLRTKMVDRVEGWTKRRLSYRGKEIFLKSMAHVLPQYAMSCYMLLEWLLNDMTVVMRHY